MLKFRKVTAGASLAHTWSGSSTSVAFSREGKGFLVVNLGADPLEAQLQTGLSAGTYCNVLLADDPLTCDIAAQVVVLDDGTANVTVSSESALALHVGGS
jgi:alpha-amylase